MTGVMSILEFVAKTKAIDQDLKAAVAGHRRELEAGAATSRGLLN